MRRRCLGASCKRWIVIEPFQPEGAPSFCSEACERAALREIQRTEREIAAAEYLAEHPKRRRAPDRYYVAARL